MSAPQSPQAAGAGMAKRRSMTFRKNGEMSLPTPGGHHHSVGSGDRYVAATLPLIKRA
jgi:hypothetical protein